MEPSPEGPSSVAPEGYQGPDVEAGIEGDELQIKITVSTGGYKLRLMETLRQENTTHVKVCLEAPSEKEAVTQAVEDKALSVAMVEAMGPVHVHLQQIQRGAEYVVEPEYVLARIVTR